MKVNWGTSIVIAIIAFIGFILFFVIKMSTNSKYDHDLVTEDYYQQELLYQTDIDKETNSRNLKEDVRITQLSEGIDITFPKNLDISLIKGKVFLYRPSNKQLDFEIPISLSNHNLLIPDNRLLDGRWNIKIDWSYKENNYLFKKELTY
ncbi:MAG: cytochrome C oxidase Cbb3 [Winogradskyella sp.]|nr:FixH family protein [Bacteroidia bacterium]NNK40535.1 cytochrome C oxidase Cbb3 [Winogradskyella sp.]